MPAPEITAQQLLTEVKAAILAVLTRGQDVTVQGKRYTRANLSDLRAMRTELEREVRRERTGGIRIRQAVPRG